MIIHNQNPPVGWAPKKVTDRTSFVCPRMDCDNRRGNENANWDKKKQKLPEVLQKPRGPKLLADCGVFVTPLFKKHRVLQTD